MKSMKAKNLPGDQALKLLPGFPEISLIVNQGAGTSGPLIFSRRFLLDNLSAYPYNEEYYVMPRAACTSIEVCCLACPGGGALLSLHHAWPRSRTLFPRLHFPT